MPVPGVAGGVHHLSMSSVSYLAHQHPRVPQPTFNQSTRTETQEHAPQVTYPLASVYSFSRAKVKIVDTSGSISPDIHSEGKQS